MTCTATAATTDQFSVELVLDPLLLRVEASSMKTRPLAYDDRLGCTAGASSVVVQRLE